MKPGGMRGLTTAACCHEVHHAPDVPKKGPCAGRRNEERAGTAAGRGCHPRDGRRESPGESSSRRACASGIQNPPRCCIVPCIVLCLSSCLACVCSNNGTFFLGSPSPVWAFQPPQNPRSGAAPIGTVSAVCEKPPRFFRQSSWGFAVLLPTGRTRRSSRCSSPAGGPAKTTRLAGQTPQSRFEARFSPARSILPSAR